MNIRPGWSRACSDLGFPQTGIYLDGGSGTKTSLGIGLTLSASAGQNGLTSGLID